MYVSTTPATYPYLYPQEVRIRAPHIVFPSLITCSRPYCFPEQIPYILAPPLAQGTPLTCTSETLPPHPILTESAEVSPTYIQIPTLVVPYLSFPTLLYQP